MTPNTIPSWDSKTYLSFFTSRGQLQEDVVQVPSPNLHAAALDERFRLEHKKGITYITCRSTLTRTVCRVPQQELCRWLSIAIVRRERGAVLEGACLAASRLHGPKLSLTAAVVGSPYHHPLVPVCYVTSLLL